MGLKHHTLLPLVRLGRTSLALFQKGTELRLQGLQVADGFIDLLHFPQQPILHLPARQALAILEGQQFLNVIQA